MVFAMKKVSVAVLVLLIVSYVIYSMSTRYIEDYSPSEIYQAFQDDEIQALIDFHYKDFLFRNVEVISYERSVLKEGKYSVALHQESFWFPTVLCYLDFSELKGVNEGDKVDISGRLTNYDNYDRVIFENCKIHEVFP